MFDNIGSLLLFHVLIRSWIFFLGMKAYFYSDKLFLYVTDKNIRHNSILIVRPIDTVLA